MLKQAARPLTRALRFESGAWATCSRQTTTITVGPEHYEVPAGHHESDMRATSCNIGLNRRRDLTLRQDLRLHTSSGKFTLSDLFRGKLAIVFGVPDMGRVCTEAHVPSYKNLAPEMRDAGVEKVFCVAVAEPEEAEAWANQNKLSDTNIEMLSDKNGSFVRLLGVNLEPPGTEGPKSQRFAALIEDGILLKLRVEEKLKDMDAASAESMLDCLKHLQSLNA